MKKKSNSAIFFQVNLVLFLGCILDGLTTYIALKSGVGVEVTRFLSKISSVNMMVCFLFLAPPLISVFTIPLVYNFDRLKAFINNTDSISFVLTTYTPDKYSQYIFFVSSISCFIGLAKILAAINNSVVILFGATLVTEKNYALIIAVLFLPLFISSIYTLRWTLLRASRE